MVAETELSQLASMRLMGLMMVVVVVVISIESFIYCMIVVPLILILKTSSSTAHQLAQITVKYDEVDGGVGKSVKKLSKGQRIVKKSEKPQRPEKLQRSLVWRNVYQSTDPSLI